MSHVSSKCQRNTRISRRDFIGGSTAIACGIASTAGRSDESPLDAPARGKQAYPDRIAFNVWVNDVRSKPHVPYVPWPDPILDDGTVEGIIRALDAQSCAGYNMVDIFGLFAPRGWPVDLAGAVDKERDRRVRQIIRAAHQRGIRVLYGLGVYTWEFGQIIKEIPEVQGTNPNAMCASKEASWQWQKKVNDFLLRYDFDGFHLESADLGRCSCEKCQDAWPNDVAYHKYINTRTARHLKSQRPDAYLSVILLNWTGWGKQFTEAEKTLLVETGKEVDSLVDQGHRQTYLSREERRPLVKRLHCHYGTSGGVWTYAPPRWDRLRWFLPYTIRTGAHLRDLYEDGGRVVLYYQSPVINPGVEVNIAFGGRMMCDVDKAAEDVLAEVLEDLYRPKRPSAHRKLVQVFQRAENIYFENWTEKARENPMRPGEIYLEPLAGSIPGASTYLIAYLDREGRSAYRDGLVSILKDLSAVENEFSDGGRIDRIKECIGHAIVDEENLRM